jgi:hypothetical protein
LGKARITTFKTMVSTTDRTTETASHCTVPGSRRSR